MSEVVSITRASGSYSSLPRCVPQGVTEPAQGTQRPPSAEKSTGAVSTAFSSPLVGSRSTLVT